MTCILFIPVIIVYGETYDLSFFENNNQLVSEECFIVLNINETIVDEEIKFLLNEVTNVYGMYNSFVNIYDTNYHYSLQTYDINHNLLDEYGLYTSLLTFYDSFETDNLGGIILTEKSAINAYINFNSNINSIEINNNGIITDLNINSLDIKCEMACGIENELINFPSQRCCNGFILSEQEDDSYFCIKCGDNICSKYEDGYSCFEDCKYHYSFHDIIYEWVYTRATLDKTFKIISS